MPRGRRLDAQVHRGDDEAFRPGRRHHIGLRCRHLAGEVGAFHAGRGEHPLEQRVRVLLQAAHADPHGTALTQVAGQRPGVDAADADDSLRGQVVGERPPGPPAARDASRVADDVAADPDPPRLRVVVVHAGVADVRGRLDDDLAVVRRVGERFLVTGHPRAEHGLAKRLADGAVCLASEGPAVLEHEERVSHPADHPSGGRGLAPRRSRR